MRWGIVIEEVVAIEWDTTAQVTGLEGLGVGGEGQVGLNSREGVGRGTREGGGKAEDQRGIW